MLDAQGAFDLEGTFVAASRGPTRDDAGAAAARYQGRVKGDSLSLIVTSDGKEIGSFSLTRGRQSVLRKCG